MSVRRRRLARLEASAVPSSGGPSGGPSWRTPEQKAERERRFEELYRELGMPWPPMPEDPRRATEKLFDLIEEHREATERKERYDDCPRES